MDRPNLYPSAGLRHFTAGILAYFGLPEADAAVGATVLHDADLAGISTHGIANLATHAHYVKGLRNGEVDPRGQISVLRDAPVAAAWDSGKGFGPVVAYRAMESAIARAQATGVGMVTVRDGRHFGANGFFAEMATREGLMGMVTANTPVAGFPPGARRPVVGTNPFAFAAPVGDGPPLVVDVSLTAVSGTRVINAGLVGEAVPEGWVVDAGGEPSTDPVAIRRGGGLELLGGRVAGHKGYGLALMVDSLGILAGNGSGIWQAAYSDDWSQGQWFAAWRIDLFTDRDAFGAEMARVARYAGESGVHLPGQRRAAHRAELEASGIPLPGAVVADLERLGAETGVPLPPPLPG